MKVKEFEKLKKEKTIEEIIKLHMESKIWLTDKQLDELLQKSRKWE